MSFGRRQLAGRAAGLAPADKHVDAPPLQPMDSGESQQHCANAATDMITMLIAAYSSRDSLRAPCAICAGAVLVGEFALRSTGLRLPEQGLVRSDAANDLLYQGILDGRATAWMFLMHAAIEAGVATFAMPQIETIATRIDPHQNGFFAVSVPDRYRPLEWPLNAGPRFRQRVFAIADSHDLTLRAATIALAAATGQLIIRAREEMPPLIAVTLAAETMLSAARLAPLMEPVTV